MSVCHQSPKKLKIIHSTSTTTMGGKSGAATMAMAIPTIFFCHRTNQARKSKGIVGMAKWPTMADLWPSVAGSMAKQNLSHGHGHGGHTRFYIHGTNDLAIAHTYVYIITKIITTPTKTKTIRSLKMHFVASEHRNSLLVTVNISKSKYYYIIIREDFNKKKE